MLWYIYSQIDDPFEGEELANLATLMDQMGAKYAVEKYVSCDKDSACLVLT